MESHSKVCSKCGKEKSRTDFHKNASNKDGLNHHCKSCRAHYRKRSYQNNREREMERSKNRYQENRKQLSEYYKWRYKENREQKLDYVKQYYKKNREQKLRYNKRYRQENPEKIAAKYAKRRALKRDGVPDFLEGCSVEKQRLVQIYKLRNLLTKATGFEHHVDHIWPLSKGGPHWSGNLQIITAEENLSKGDKLCEETARVIQESLDEYLSSRQ